MSSHANNASFPHSICFCLAPIISACWTVHTPCIFSDRNPHGIVQCFWTFGGKRHSLTSSTWPCWRVQIDLPNMRVHHEYVCCVSSSITAVLSNKCGFQLQYQMIFCVWLLAFGPQLCEQLRRYNVVPALSDILQESVKEKVTRIILAAFRVRTPRPPSTPPTEISTVGGGAKKYTIVKRSDLDIG